MKKIFAECCRIAAAYNPKHPEYQCYKHYSFVIQNNKIVEWATNHMGTADPRWYRPNQKMHAEYMVWKKARGVVDRRKPFQMVNIRLGKRGDMKMSKPCECCTAFLSNLNCDRVYFSTGVGFARLNMSEIDL